MINSELCIDRSIERDDIPPGEPWDGWRLMILEPSVFNGLTNKEKAFYMMAWGNLAPSTHNTQPVIGAIDQQGQIALYLDRQFILPHSDPEGRQAVISAGAFVENMNSVANSYGGTMFIEMLTTNRKDIEPLRSGGGSEGNVMLARAKFEWKGVEEVDEQLLRVMSQRKNNRVEFDRTPIQKEVQQELERRVSAYAGVGLSLVTARGQLQLLAGFQGQADAGAVRMEPFRQELADGWLFPGDGNVEKLRGMRMSEFGLNQVAAVAFYRKLIGEERLLPRDIQGFGGLGKMRVESASAVGFLTVADESIEAWLNAGRAYEHLALYLKSLGYDTAMHAAITETSYPELKLISLLVRPMLGTLRTPVVMFRIGKPIEGREIQPHSSRVPLDQIIMDD